MTTMTREVSMRLEERLQGQILITINEMSCIQVYIFKETNVDRLDSAKDDFFDKLDILRRLLAIQIPNKKERNTVLDYICDGIGRRAWQEYVNGVETRV
jgi:hypothetical protein